LIFTQQSSLQTKEPWLNFVLKAFDFVSRAKFLSKINLVLQNEGFITDLLNKSHYEKILLQPFKEKF